MNPTPVDTAARDAGAPAGLAANPARRLASGLIDVAVILVAGVAYTLVVGGSPSEGGGLVFTVNDQTVSGGPAWLFVGLAALYFVVSELATGRTLGKLFTGLKVEMADGTPLRPSAVIIRNLLRVVDGLPYVVPNLLGFIVVASTKRKQRLGDLAAKTVVVHR